MVRDIYKAKEAKNINELINWIKKGPNKIEKSNRFKEAINIDFYWSSFRSDAELRELENEINSINAKSVCSG